MKQIIISWILFSILILAGCKNGHNNHTETSSSLTKAEEDKHTKIQGNFISIEKGKQELAGIKTDTVKFRNINSTSSILGTVAIDEEHVKIISSPVKGRIDKLFVKNTGVYLKRGSPIYSIYSEQVQADEKEYLSFFENAKITSMTSKLTNDLVRASKNKLLLWGMSEKQISELEAAGKPGSLITIYSREAGYVNEVIITEGMYVEAGSPLVKITSFNQVWVEAQLFPNEISGISEIKTFQIFSESNPEEVYKGTLVYNNPALEEGKRIYLLKIRINNSGGKLIPGTLVSVIPEKSFKNVMAIPKSALLLEKMKTVWVLVHDNTFQQRMVETGTENKYWVEILSGIKEGEIIVTSGAYLINSEFILKSGAGQRHEH